MRMEKHLNKGITTCFAVSTCCDNRVEDKTTLFFFLLIYKKFKLLLSLLNVKQKKQFHRCNFWVITDIYDIVIIIKVYTFYWMEQQELTKV